MPTPLDRALHSKGLFFGFAGIIGAVAAWSIWGSGDIFPQESDPVGDPENWTETEMKRWLNKRGLMPTGKETRDELLARVKANLRAPQP